VISFVRINDPLRLIPIFLIFILLRVLFISNEVPLTALEIYWTVLGKKLNSGAIMYTDIWDNTPPFAVFTYWILAKMGGTVLIHRIFAIILVMIQAYIFNAVLLKKNIHREKSYLPALLYVLLMFSFFDFLTLSPLLISMTFLMLLLRNIFWLNDGAKDEQIFNIGIYLGLAILSYLPNWVLLFFVLLCITFFRSATFRQYMLFVYGLLITLGLTILLYGFKVGYEGIFTNYFFTLLDFNFTQSYLTLKGFAPLLALFIFFLLIGLFKTYTERGFINYQSLCQLIMILWVFFNVITFFINNKIAPLQLMIFVPSLAFFLTYFFLIIKREWLSEVFFLMFLGLLFGTSYYNLHFVKSEQVRYWKLPTETKYNAIQNKKILVLGENFLPYQNNQLTTPYINWDLSQRHFSNLNQYNIVVEVYKNLQKDFPEVIIDEQNMMPQLIKSIPILGKIYQKDKNNNTVFYLQKK
jgi:hypothetical protein